MEIDILCNVCTKGVYETDFILKVQIHSIPNSSSFVSFATSHFGPNRISLNVRTHYFCTPLFEVKTYNTQQENCLHIKPDMYSC